MCLQHNVQWKPKMLSKREGAQGILQQRPSSEREKQTRQIYTAKQAGRHTLTIKLMEAN